MADGKLGTGATTGSWFVGITSVKLVHPKYTLIMYVKNKIQSNNESIC